MADNLQDTPANVDTPTQDVGYSNQSFKLDTSKSDPQPPPYEEVQPLPPETVQYYPNQTTPVVFDAEPQTWSQQTTAVVNVDPPPPVIIQQRPAKQQWCQPTRTMIFACFVFWFCNYLFGLIAFLMAVVAEKVKYTDPIRGYNLGRASIRTSIAGIIITVVFLAIGLGLGFGTGGNGSGGSSSSSTSNTYVFHAPRRYG